MKKLIFALGAPLALSAQPVMAQEEDSGADMVAAMAEMFKVDPLTAEQQARLPLAREVIVTIMPEGAMVEAMDGMFDGMMKPLMKMASAATSETLEKDLGVVSIPREMSEAEIMEASLLIDPVREERNERITELMPELMADMMRPMEPIMREAMIEIYAIHFTNKELTDLRAFFQTESGLSYARKSLTLQQDPRMVSAMMNSMPVIMGSIGDMVKKMEERMADLPEQRVYADLSAEQRQRLEALTGLEQAELESGLEAAAQRREQAKQMPQGF
jgi:hypothetical protein